MAKKSLGNTVLGWFVVREEEEGDAPSEAASDEVEVDTAEPEAEPQRVISKYNAAKQKAPLPPPPSDDAPPSVRLPGDVPQVAAGAIPDAAMFSKVFQAAEISAEEQARVDKAMTLLESLPRETPKEVRRQIVEASLKAFGIPVDEIIEAAAQEIQALEAYIQQGERHTQGVLQDANGQIEKLSARILEIKKLMELQIRTQQGVVRASNDHKLRIQSVLEFFGQEAVARVVHASPKLVEPK